MAKRTNEGLWRRSKAKALKKMGGKHSARAMQLAVKYYKDAGGRYAGRKSRGNSLSRWGREKWGYDPKARKKGRYLPSKAWKKLTPAQRSATNSAKRRATRRGKRKSKWSKAVARAYRKSRG